MPSIYPDRPQADDPDRWPLVEQLVVLYLAGTGLTVLIWLAAMLVDQGWRFLVWPSPGPP